MSETESTRAFSDVSRSEYQMVGPYKLLQQIGAGGMGEVWMAQQDDPLRRRVALKLVKAGMDTREVIARFEAERQALALMDHHNIAKVLDAGTYRERPYFAMELVQGVPLNEYCNQNQLSLNERLALFIPVCKAVQHAHQKGIIHRDLKPSNVLITLYDGQPVPKVIDFGLAKALGHQTKLTDKTVFTEFGRILGTIQYMSPEQAEMNALDVDTRSDIYSLGVMLYEQLTGSTPIDREAAQRLAHDEMLRWVREKEPPRPSVRLTESGDAIAGISAQRKVEAQKLQTLLRGDLDWIVMKTLEKDRTRRYDSAGELADDVQHFLDDEPVNARPPSLGYRLQKTVHRHRVAFFVAATLLLLLSLGVAGTAWQAIRATKAEAHARRMADAERAAREEAERQAVLADQQRTSAQQAEQEARLQLGRAERLRREADWRLYVNKIQRAQAKWEFGDPSAAIDILQSSRTDLRGWEYEFLHAKFHQAQATVTGVAALAFSPDGRRMVARSRDGTVKVRDAETGNEIITLSGNTDMFSSMAVSPDGKRIVGAIGYSADFNSDGKRTVGPIELPTKNAKAELDRPIRVWNSETGEEELTLNEDDSVICVAFSPDGKRIVAGSVEVTVWNAETGEVDLEMEVNDGYVSAVAFSPDGQRIVTASDKTVKLWNAQTGAEELTLQAGIGVNCIAFSPDGKRIVSGGWDKTIKVWNATTGKEVLTRTAHARGVNCVAFNADGTRIVSGSRNVKVWDAKTGDLKVTLKGHAGGVTSAVFKNGGKHIVSSGQDHTVRIWSSEQAATPTKFKGAGGVLCAAISGDGKRIASGNFGKVTVWDADTGSAIFTLNIEARVDDVAFSPDGSFIAGIAKAIRVWDAKTGKETRKFAQDLGTELRRVAFSPDGKRIVSGGMDETVRVWNAMTGQEELTLQGHGDGVNCVAFSPDGKRIVSGDFDNAVRVWDAVSGEEDIFALKHALKGHADGVHCVAFSPDGNRIVSGGCGKRASIKVWNTQTGEEVFALDGHAQCIWSLAFSPDGSRIVSGSSDETVKVWNAETGQELLTLNGQEAPILSVSFCPDGKVLASVGSDASVKFWGADATDGRNASDPTK